MKAKAPQRRGGYGVEQGKAWESSGHSGNLQAKCKGSGQVAGRVPHHASQKQNGFIRITLKYNWL
jgi:hypothetical protein